MTRSAARFFPPVFKWPSQADRQTDKQTHGEAGRHGLTPGGITDRTDDFDNCPLRAHSHARAHTHARPCRNFHFTFSWRWRKGRRENGRRGECCFFKSEGERVCVCEREREGPLCPPETRKGIELICCCLVSAYGALSCTTVRGRGGEERAVLTHYELHHGHRR